MSTYADTSFLFSLYASDAHSPKADVWRLAHPAPLPFAALHRLELRNALSLAIFQRRLTLVEVQGVWQAVESDLAAGLLVNRDGPWDRILADAEAFAGTHTPVIGCRTLDMLHVAAAGIFGVDEFCTFDTRQADLARAIGLSVVIP